MRPGEWSRSRYWLNHFLNARHRRAKAAWDVPACAAATDVAAAAWLGVVTARPGIDRAWIASHAAMRCQGDPAYVQTLRLVGREQQHHRGQAARLLDRLGLPRPAPPAETHDWVRPLGVRFCLSLQWMTNILDSVVLDELAASCRDPALRTVAATIAQERRVHTAFITERLADEFADFHFIRRNLRRWRLRGMLTGLAPRHLVRQRVLLEAMRLSPLAWTARTRHRFEATLEQMVPYRRDALLHLLTHQREQPFEQATIRGL